MSIIFDIPDSKPLPFGNYTAKLEKIELVDANPERKFDAGVRYTFQITQGDHSGNRVSRTTDRNWKSHTAAGKLLSEIIGKSLGGGRLDVEGFIGKPYMIKVQAGQGGKPRVESVSLIPT